MDAVEADLDEIEVDGAYLLKEDDHVVVMADVYLATEDVEDGTTFVKVVSMAKAVSTIVGWSCSLPPSL